MTVDEYERASPSQPKLGVQIVATELSGAMLAASKAAEYDTLAIARGLSSERLQRYFEPKGPGRWVVKPAVRARVEFDVPPVRCIFFGEKIQWNEARTRRAGGSFDDIKRCARPGSRC